MVTEALQWDDAENPGWIEAVESWDWTDWKIENEFVGWVKSGPCPRCDHTIAIYQEVHVYALPLDSPTRVRAGCNCQHKHDGRPSDDPLKGCGSHGTVTGAP